MEGINLVQTTERTPITEIKEDGTEEKGGQEELQHDLSVTTTTTSEQV